MVTIICLCYNHAKYITEALASVFAQTYSDWELLIADDASTDDSRQVILDFLEQQKKEGHTQKVIFQANQENQGNCKTFNQMFAQARGAYILDLAGDDVLLPTRLVEQVAFFQTLPTKYGVIFSNAVHIDEAGKVLHTHHTPEEVVPQGDIYAALLQRYFICTPTMLMHRQVLEELGGYDADLSYEDFDFWVRSARNYWYAYQPIITTQKRKVHNSLSAQFYRTRQNAHLQSTLVVLEKAFALNKTDAEKQAWQICMAYHTRQAFFTQNFDLVAAYSELWRKMPEAQLPTWLSIVRFFSKRKIKIFWLYKWYMRWRYGKF